MSGFANEQYSSILFGSNKKKAPTLLSMEAPNKLKRA